MQRASWVERLGLPPVRSREQPGVAAAGDVGSKKELLPPPPTLQGAIDSLSYEDPWPVNDHASADSGEHVVGEHVSGLTLIKVDCEGCEEHFLTAAAGLIQQWLPVIIIEIWDDEMREKRGLSTAM